MQDRKASCITARATLLSTCNQHLSQRKCSNLIIENTIGSRVKYHEQVLSKTYLDLGIHNVFRNTIGKVRKDSAPG